MLKSLYSGISGMKGFQTKLDVIGNNVANVNTVGFKKSRVMFQDILNQNIAGASAPNAQQGGVNPKQIGLGSKISSIDTVHTPGSPMTTNVATDLAIDGDAFFVVSSDVPASVTVNPGDPLPAPIEVKNYLTKAGNFTRDQNGDIVNSNGFFVVGTTNNSGDLRINITKDESSGENFTSYSIDSYGNITVVNDQAESGKLAWNATSGYYLNDGVTNAGDIISLKTGVTSNPGGLKKLGNTIFEATANSEVTYGKIDPYIGGQIITGTLEMSNVDLTEEFTEMIVAQRGFQANARTITTSDSILEEVVNLKR
jgi:flagellar hook protein FlgE